MAKKARTRSRPQLHSRKSKYVESMGIGKFNIKGTSYVGAFAMATDRHIFTGNGTSPGAVGTMANALGAKPIVFSIFDTDMIGILARANSNGILLSRVVGDRELSELKSQNPDCKIGILQSNLNAIGNNILANDKIAIINPDYDRTAEKEIADILSVEVFREQIGGFKTTGATNILTNKGMVINNKTTDEQKEKIDKLTGFDSIRSTANTGALSIGLGAVANSNGAVAGEDTTGYELARITEALGLND
jgi:translation initiation factor 6